MSPTPASCTPQRKRSRQIAKLTPEKLERKRTQDRIAQRAARQRTKQYIARLESAVRELQSQTSSDQVVKELTSRNQELTAEVAYLQTCLTFKNAIVSWTPFQELYHVEKHLQFPRPAVSALPGPWTYQQVSGPSNASAFNTIPPSAEISGTTMFTDKQRQHGNADQRTRLEHSLAW